MSQQPVSRRRQGVYWMLTIPHASFTPYLPDGVTWIRGQLEIGNESHPDVEGGGYLHWQILVAFCSKKSCGQVREMFGPHHAELTRSSQAEEYVWKEETRVAGTQFELGGKPMDRSSRTDWERVRNCAKLGNLDDPSIPADVFIRYYSSLRRIAADYAVPVAMERSCVVYWGPTGTGKSRRAWEEAGGEAFIKNPRTKWWCGYRGESHAIIDEFRGSIDVSYLLRWLDRYPVTVETKGGSMPLLVSRMWITSNLHPRDWYRDVDFATIEALERRINIVEMP